MEYDTLHTQYCPAVRQLRTHTHIHRTNMYVDFLLSCTLEYSGMTKILSANGIDHNVVILQGI